MNNLLLETPSWWQTLSQNILFNTTKDNLAATRFKLVPSKRPRPVFGPLLHEFEISFLDNLFHNKVAWPSGLRRWFKAPVSSEARVRISPLPNYLFVALQRTFCDYVCHQLVVSRNKLSPKLMLLSVRYYGSTEEKITHIGNQYEPLEEGTDTAYLCLISYSLV